MSPENVKSESSVIVWSESANNTLPAVNEESFMPALAVINPLAAIVDADNVMPDISPLSMLTLVKV